MTLAITLAVALVTLVGAMWIVFAHPRALVLATMFALAAAPTLQVPRVRVAVIAPLAVMCLAARFAGRWDFGPPQWAEALLLLLIFASLFSLVGNELSWHSVHDFLWWASMTSLVIPLSALDEGERVRAGRAYALGAGLGALFGLALRLADPHARLIPHLGFLGYTPDHIALVPGRGGGTTLRLTGPYLEPNLAGLMMTFGLVLALALLRGKTRVLTSCVLIGAIGLTFSRAALGSVVVFAVLLLVAGPIPSNTRRRITAVALCAAAALVAVPAVRWRLQTSFGPSDIGSMARAAALRSFPQQMSGHWLLGRGFGLPELTNGKVAYEQATRIVANTPLLTIYRGGVAVGLVFVTTLVLAARHAWRLLRSGPMEGAFLGAGALGLILVAMELDYPVVTAAPAIAMFSVMLAFLNQPPLISARPLEPDPGLVPTVRR